MAYPTRNKEDVKLDFGETNYTSQPTAPSTTTQPTVLNPTSPSPAPATPQQDPILQQQALTDLARTESPTDLARAESSETASTPITTSASQQTPLGRPPPPPPQALPPPPPPSTGTGTEMSYGIPESWAPTSEYAVEDPLQVGTYDIGQDVALRDPSLMGGDQAFGAFQGDLDRRMAEIQADEQAQYGDLAAMQQQHQGFLDTRLGQVGAMESGLGRRAAAMNAAMGRGMGGGFGGAMAQASLQGTQMRGDILAGHQREALDLAGRKLGIRDAATARRMGMLNMMAGQASRRGDMEQADRFKQLAADMYNREVGVGAARDVWGAQTEADRAARADRQQAHEDLWRVGQDAARDQWAAEVDVGREERGDIRNVGDFERQMQLEALRIGG